MSEFTQAFELHNMIGGPAGTSVPQVMYRSEDGILHVYGTVVPVDGSTDYAESCIFHKIGGSGSSLRRREKRRTSDLRMLWRGWTP